MTPLQSAVLDELRDHDTPISSYRVAAHLEGRGYSVDATTTGAVLATLRKRGLVSKDKVPAGFAWVRGERVRQFQSVWKINAVAEKIQQGVLL